MESVPISFRRFIMKITTKNDDILILSRYFFTTQVMHENTIRTLRRDRKKTKLSDRCMVYFDLWLSTMFVVVEGMEKCKVKDPNFGSVKKNHRNILEGYRNSVFHFHNDNIKKEKFVEIEEIIPWAEDLYYALLDYFRSYVIKGFKEEIIEVIE